MSATGSAIQLGMSLVQRDHGILCAEIPIKSVGIPGICPPRAARRPAGVSCLSELVMVTVC